MGQHPINCRDCEHFLKHATSSNCAGCYDDCERPMFIPKEKSDNVILQVFGGKTIKIGLSDWAKQDALVNKMAELSDGKLSDEELDLFDGLKRTMGEIAGIE